MIQKAGGAITTALTESTHFYSKDREHKAIPPNMGPCRTRPGEIIFDLEFQRRLYHLSPDRGRVSVLPK